MFRVESVTGALFVAMDDEQEAMVEARQRLEDDPELREVYIAHEDRYLWRATHAPDLNWNTIVVVIPFDEKLTIPPGFQMIDPQFDYLDAYADNWAKRTAMAEEENNQ